MLGRGYQGKNLQWLIKVSLSCLPRCPIALLCPKGYTHGLPMQHLCGTCASRPAPSELGPQGSSTPQPRLVCRGMVKPSGHLVQRKADRQGTAKRTLTARVWPQAFSAIEKACGTGLRAEGKGRAGSKERLQLMWQSVSPVLIGNYTLTGC